MECCDVVSRVQVEQSLVDPVHNLLDRIPRSEHQVHNVCRAQVLEILYALEQESILVECIQSIELAQRLGFAETVHDYPQRSSSCALRDPESRGGEQAN